MNSPLGVYRLLLKTQRRVFGEDLPMVKAMKEKTKEIFIQNRTETDATKIQGLIKEAVDLADFLKSRVVQAQVESGSNTVRKSFVYGNCLDISLRKGDHPSGVLKLEQIGTKKNILIGT
jgi:complex III assembly factor LYRM7